MNAWWSRLVVKSHTMAYDTSNGSTSSNSPITQFSDVIGLEVSMQFAPIRRLDDHALAGAELQLRGPDNSSLCSAHALRRASQLMQQRSEFDSHKLAMSRTALACTVADRLPLLVAVDSASRAALNAPGIEGVTRNLQRIVITVDSASVLTDPHNSLAVIREARAGGRLIALDGVGIDRHSATLLSLVEPDIIITSAELLSKAAYFEVGTTVHALGAYVERSNAIILAEGVDSESSRLAAITIGATYGTGELYPAVDDPSSLLSEPVVAMPDSPVWSDPIPDVGTPYSIVSAHSRIRRGTKRLLIQLSKSLEAQAATSGSSMLVLGTFQQAEHFTASTTARWRHLADTVGFAGVYGVGLSVMLDGKVQHAPLDPGDDLVNEWTVVTLGPHHAAMLSARDLHDNGPDLERTFDFVQTYDRTTVTQAAHSILRRYPKTNS